MNSSKSTANNSNNTAKTSRNITKILIITLALLVAAAAVLTTAGCSRNSDPDARWETVNIAPKPLEAQPEPEDEGQAVTFTVSGTISSNMVVQRNAYFNVFGQSENPGAVIYGEFMGEKRYGKVGEDGKWTITFSAHDAVREGQELRIYPKNGEAKEFKDILVGDVWVITGQSNAELWYVSAEPTAPEFTREIKKDDLIRIYAQTRQSVMDAIEAGIIDGKTPLEDVISGSTHWAKTTAGTVTAFSALGYYFGKELSKSIDVPLGLIMAASGGSTLHELMPRKIADELGFTTGAAVPQCGFYNTLIYPFTHNKIAGMVFYQGESECAGGAYMNYARNLKRTVSGYREVWELCFPFINVQLSSHGFTGDQYWPELRYIRASQFDAYRSIMNSYIVTAMDQGFQEGDPDWAHPMYKLELGRRAAKIAASMVYGVGDAEYALAPEPDVIKWNSDNSVEITFKHVGDGLKLLSGDNIEGLYLTDEYGDKMFCEVEMVDGKTIRLTTNRSAVSISYGMFNVNSPEKSNLANSEGIPMPAFYIEKDAK